MIWTICFCLSAAVLILSLLFAVTSARAYRSGKLLTPFRTIFAGVFLAVLIGLFPVFEEMLAGEPAHGLKLLLFSVLQTLQVFTINVGGDFILDNISASPTGISGAYSVYMSVLFFAAPLLTFGFLISLFRDFLTGLTYRLHRWGDVYVFSALNEKSLMLAEDLRKNHSRALLVFTDVDKEEENVPDELVEAARELKALIFQKDILSVDFSRHSKQASLTFFAIGEKEGDNLVQGLKLLDRYHGREHTHLYVFSTGAEGELLFSNAAKGNMKVRRINEVRSLVYRYLYTQGCELFSHASPSQGGEKKITAVVAGLGRLGTELVKALAWFCQMDGYVIEIHGFDRDPLAEDRFSASCPELMSDRYNGVVVPGESRYTIRIHSGIDIGTKTFADQILSLSDITLAFVCLGDDERNISCAADLRMLCERAGSKPVIRPVVYSAEEADALAGITNYRGQAYGIEAIGDLESIYSEEVLLGSELEQLALQRHLKWGQEEEFWQYEYNYRSSMASAIHMKARQDLAVPGAEKREEDLSPEERDRIEQLEHKRWNAYMRSEGYVYSGSPDKSSRNDLAKMHHDLVEFAALSEEDKRKDSSVGSL